MAMFDTFLNYAILFFMISLSQIKSSEILVNCPFIIQNTTNSNAFYNLSIPWDLSLAYKNLSIFDINIIFALINVAIHNDTGFAWNYAENLNDGRGITFGIVGFASGTFDGRRVIETIYKTSLAQGINHPLNAYYQAFQNIDNTEHDIYANTSYIGGLENFIQDFKTYGNDDISKQAQLDMINQLYWQPAINKAKELKVNYSTTIAQFFDICLNHGCDADGFNNKGLIQLINETDYAVNSNLTNGYNEQKWVSKLYEIRKQYLDSDTVRNSSYQRLEIQRRLGDYGNMNLTTPIQITCIDLYQSGEKIRFVLIFIVLYFIIMAYS